MPAWVSHLGRPRAQPFSLSAQATCAHKPHLGVMIAVLAHKDGSAPWTRQDHWNKVAPRAYDVGMRFCGQSCGCCRAENAEVFGACLACSQVQPTVEHIFAIIKGLVGPDDLEETTAAKTFARACRNPETQSQRRDTTCCRNMVFATPAVKTLILSFAYDEWYPTSQRVGTICVPLVRMASRMIDEDLEPEP